MNDKEYIYIKEDLKKSIGERLYKHCVNVMNTAADLAQKYGVSTQKAKTAGLLHDCGKLLNQNVKNLEHAFTGSNIAASKYGVDDTNVLDAILYHTTGREDMTMLEKIIYISDKIEPDRSYEGVEEIRKLAFSNIDAAIVKSLEITFKYLESKNIEIDKQSLLTYEYLKRKITLGI